LRRLRRELKLLLKFLLDSGKSEPATQEPVNREMKPMRGRVKSLQKSWRVLSVALAFSPLKRVILLGDWVGVACRVSPSLPGQGTANSLGDQDKLPKDISP
jgi:hypothetical protein